MVIRAIEAIRRIKLKDFLTPFIFLLLLVPSWFFKLINVIRGKRLWLVAEDGEARDNGYHFYKYVRECHPKDYCFYAVKTDSAGYEKVSRLGNIIKWGSLKHWLYYMSANLNISSQKSGNPCPIFWFFMHVTLGLYRNRVFLQHGITKDDAEWIYWDKTKFKYFICGAKKEYDYVKEKFGYPEGSVLLTGFPRWDNLKNVSGQDEHKSILIMPTWRNWLGGDRNSIFEVSDFEETDFFKCWNSLLNNKDFIELVEGEDIKVYFYPHINMMKYINSFRSKSKNIEFVSLSDNIQKYFDKCNLLITDYSSVAFDFAYLEKPIIYYQFDEEEYRNKQYKKGYFDYRRDGFGLTTRDEGEVVDRIKHYYKHSFELELTYIERMRSFFILHDRHNRRRVYESIKNNRCGQKRDNSGKIKVMFVSNKMNYGGLETFLMNVFRKISNQRKYKVVFLTFQSYRFDYEDEIIKKGGSIIRIPSTRNPIRRYIDLLRVIKEEQPNVVHSNVAFENALVMKAAKRSGVKVRISHSHTTCPDKNGRKHYHNIMAGMMRRNATKLVACGKEAGQNLFRSCDFEILQNGIDIQKFIFDNNSRKKYRDEFGIKDEDIVIGHIGRLAKVKNHEYMLQILKELDDKRYKMIFVGDGELKDRLLAKANDYGVRDRVLFLGNRNDTDKIYNAFDYFLFPSVYEGLPMALVEAQANGLPIVASSTITPDVRLNKNFIFKDIDDNARNWKDEICKMNKSRVTPSEKLLDYSIDRVIEKLRFIYEGRMQ